MEQINIRKTLNFENGSIEVRYNGIETKKGIDKNNIEQLLDDFIEKQNHSDMLENVKRVRTILKDYEEKLLVLYYCDEKGSELVKYDNSHLFRFEKTKNRDESDTKYNIKYEPTSGIKLDYNDLGDFDGKVDQLSSVGSMIDINQFNYRINQ